jgi:2-C-methyl-D-erythritol 4-phosphate cytidylyltransferase
MGAVLQHPHCHLLASGGASRAATVLKTLQQIEARDYDWIVVHDAARPGLTTAMFERLLKALQDHPVGGLLALPVADTVKLADAQQQVQATQAREGLWTAQTPQMFRYHVLLKALQQADIAPTDEAQAVEALGLKPQLVAGSLRNMKITYPPDLALVEAMMQIKDDE